MDTELKNKGGIIMARIVTYECEQCGSEIVVTPTGETRLSPIYCCGITVTQVSAVGMKQAAPKKKTAPKVVKKTVTKKPVKKTVTKKKPTVKKKTS
jgi:hypothetical protein